MLSLKVASSVQAYYIAAQVPASTNRIRGYIIDLFIVHQFHSNITSDHQPKISSNFNYLVPDWSRGYSVPPYERMSVSTNGSKGYGTPPNGRISDLANCISAIKVAHN